MDCSLTRNRTVYDELRREMLLRSGKTEEELSALKKNSANRLMQELTRAQLTSQCTGREESTAESGLAVCRER